ncbi:MAG TPA: cupin domain-containing protein [Blastocatellia bacterium]|nr:cupin domain-containing protein [Blastocatellia bacterium]
MPFVNTSDIRPRVALPGWSGRFVNSQNMTFVYYDIAEGAQSIHEHSHVQEEVWHVMEGQIEVTIEGVTRSAGPGCVAIVPSGAPHSVNVVQACRVIVADYPTREPFGVEQEDPSR